MKKTWIWTMLGGLLTIAAAAVNLMGAISAAKQQGQIMGQEFKNVILNDPNLIPVNNTGLNQTVSGDKSAI